MKPKQRDGPIYAAGIGLSVFVLILTVLASVAVVNKLNDSADEAYAAALTRQPAQQAQQGAVGPGQSGNQLQGPVTGQTPPDRPVQDGEPSVIGPDEDTSPGDADTEPGDGDTVLPTDEPETPVSGQPDEVMPGQPSDGNQSDGEPATLVVPSEPDGSDDPAEGGTDDEGKNTETAPVGTDQDDVQSGTKQEEPVKGTGTPQSGKDTASSPTAKPADVGPADGDGGHGDGDDASEVGVTDVYLVKPGDTLSGIAKRTGADMYEIARLNGIKDVNVIYSGTELKIPGANGSGQQHVSVNTGPEE